MHSRCIFVVVALVAIVAVASMPVAPPQSPRARAVDLVKQMTLDEKISLLHGTNGPYVGNIAANSRLNIPPIRMNDGPQGFRVDRGVGDGTSTAFPSGLNIAATFDPLASFLWGFAMGEEFRAKGANVQLGPGLNVARVPRNGRNFEYMSGEDPILGRTLAGPAVEGIQKNKVIANAKHFINNNEETNRMNVSEDVDERTEWEIYLQPFIGAVKGGVLSVMCSYNRINGIWACENNATLNNDLKERIGFEGWVMSDWGATHSTLLAASSGLDQEMPGDDFFGAKLEQAVKDGEITEAMIDDKVIRILSAFIQVGAFDDPPKNDDVKVNVTSHEHNLIARDLAERSTVLLKNDASILPLNVAKLSNKGIAVLGSAGFDAPIIAGDGSGHVVAPYISTGLQAIQDAVKRHGASIPVVYKPTTPLADAVAAAKNADVAVVFVATISGEGWDRANLSLSDSENALVSAVAAANPNTIVVVSTPGAILMPWAKDVAAIATNFMPGQEAGNAVARILFGEVSPSARLPLTMPNSENEMEMTPQQYPGVPAGEPLHANYSEKLLVGYRWYHAHNVSPLFCFGHGLSYSSFEYSKLNIHHTPRGIEVSALLKNTGRYIASEVAQLYVTFPASANEPPRQLKAFEHTLPLLPGAEIPLVFFVPHEDLSVWDISSHNWQRVNGDDFVVELGSSSCDIRLSTKLSLS